MPRGRKTTITGAAPKEGLPTVAPKTIKVVVTPEIVRYEVNAKGNFIGRVRPWVHTVKFNKVIYNAGDEIECFKKQADIFVGLGCCQYSNKPLKPFDPQEPDKEIKTSHGVHRRDEIKGKTPSPTKGEYEDVVEDD